MGARRPAFALMLVLAATAMVFALAVSGSVALRSATIEAATMHDRAALEREAQSVIALALAGLTAGADIEETTTAGGSSGEGGAEEPSAPDELELPPFPSGLPFNIGGGEDGDDNGASGQGAGSGAQQKTKPRGAYSALRLIGLPTAPIEIDYLGKRYRLRFTDALGGVDINKSDEQRLIDYFDEVGLSNATAVALAHQIVDWRDDDDFRRPNGAEREDHRRRHIEIRNASFESVEELLYLPAMTSAIYELVRADLCVRSDGKTYVGASHEALMSVPGITASAVRSIESRMAAGAPITGEELRDILGLAVDTAGEHLRTTPSGSLRVIVEPLDRPGVRFVGVATVSDRRGISIGAVSLR